MKQTGGTWNPDKRSMFFMAGDFGRLRLTVDEWKPTNRFDPRVANLFAVNDFAAIGKAVDRTGPAWQQFVASLETGCDTFLDSGIFFLTNVHKRAHNTTMDEALALPPEEIDNFDWLFDVYVELCTEFGDVLWGYNELDQGGKAHKIRTRDRLEGLGLSPIPVYHPLNDGWAYFDDLAQEYDRMCFGNVVQAHGVTRHKLMATLFERHAQYPDLFVHILGMTPAELQMGLPFDSCDSSTWTAIFRYPQAVRFAASGRKRWPMPADWVQPLGASASQLLQAGNLSLLELWSLVSNISQHHDTLLDHFGPDRYPNAA